MTDVHITIITNTKPAIEVAEIPVIDGFRGIEENTPRGSSPMFHPLDHVKPTFTHLLRNDIPQVIFSSFYFYFISNSLILIKCLCETDGTHCDVNLFFDCLLTIINSLYFQSLTRKIYGKYKAKK